MGLKSSEPAQTLRLLFCQFDANRSCGANNTKTLHFVQVSQQGFKARNVYAFPHVLVYVADAHSGVSQMGKYSGDLNRQHE